MATYTMFSLLFGWGTAPQTWLLLSFFLLLGAVVQFVALKRCRRFGRWLLPTLLLLLWFALELLTPQTVNYTQLIGLEMLAFTLACLLGTILGTALFYLAETVKNRKEKSAEDR